jgi:hypothetical protein
MAGLTGVTRCRTGLSLVAGLAGITRRRTGLALATRLARLTRVVLPAGPARIVLAHALLPCGFVFEVSLCLYQNTPAT